MSKLRNTGAAEWVRTYTKTSVRQVALKLGLDPGAFDRRVKRGLTADLVIEIATAFDRDPVAALRLAEIISPKTEETVSDLLDQASQLIARAKELADEPAPLHVVSDDEITDELNAYPQAAQEATEPLEEPESP